VWRNFVQRIDERFPQLSRWLGGRLDIELPAFLASVGFHVFLLLGLGMVGYSAHAVIQREINSQVSDSSLTDQAQLDSTRQWQDLDMGDKKLTSAGEAISTSPTISPMENKNFAPSSSAAVAPVEGASGASVNPVLARIEAPKELMKAVAPTTSVYSDQISIKGNGAEHVGGVEGAVDRVANEIVRRLEKGRVLAIWLFDASGSLVVERERLAKHIDTVYSHITQLDENKRAEDGGLLTAVVSFGHDRKAMTTEPTADKAAIIEAINNVPLDETGVETTFGTVAETVRKWGHFKDKAGNVYKPMVIVVTDEVGDDEDRLEEAIDVASKAKVPVYVLGSQALFGRADGYMDYTDPKTKVVYHGLPVRQGPESVVVEQIRLPFWYEGFQYDFMDSGYGPWALSRLSAATQGIYFITRLGQKRMGFDPGLMNEYKPDWISKEKYEATVLNNPFRKAIIEAALVTQQKLPSTPPLNFNFPADSPEFKEEMRRGQEVVSRYMYTVDEALSPISSVAKLRERETSRRWQANYDLARGRLLAMKVRCYEYNWLCAQMKKDPKKFTQPGSNAWKLVPDTEIKSSDKVDAAAKEAKRLLQGVLEEHPGTPWALYAQREVKDPFGFKWAEHTVKPVVRNDNDAKEKKKKKEMTKPAPPPPKL